MDVLGMCLKRSDRLFLTGVNYKHFKIAPSVKYIPACDTNFCIINKSKIMNLQSENRNKKTLDLNIDHRDNEQNLDVYETNYNKKYLYRFKARNESTVPLDGFNSTWSEPHNPILRTSESMCSQCFHTETRYIPNTLKIDGSLSQNECNIKRKYNIHTKVHFTDSSDRDIGGLNQKLHGKLCSDKTTYCRPVVNFYNQEFLYKTMEKNAKLRRLVTQLVTARQKQKESENWNNYINELKKKHSGSAKLTGVASLNCLSAECDTLDTIKDIYETKYTSKQSNPCQNLLQDFYKPHDIEPSRYDDCRTTNKYTESPKKYNPFKMNSLCFPTSSQGRLIMQEKERIKRLTSRGYKPLFRPINEEKNVENEGVKTINRIGLRLDSDKGYIVRNSRSTNTTLECTSTQTEVEPSKTSDLVMTKGCNTNHVVYEKECTKEMRNMETTPDNYYNIDNNLKKSSLVCIEKKLDNLIHSINDFIIEMRTKNAQKRNFDRNAKYDKRNVNYTRSDSCRMARKEEIVCGFIDDSSGTTRDSSIDNYNRIQTIDNNLNKINDILMKEIGKNKLITLKGSSVGETYHPCSVKISVTIPTKEISTEVTHSLSKAAHIDDDGTVIEEIPRTDDQRIAIAVNTDPLSLLAMLRVTTEETIRRLLSYVPTIDYYSYLTKLQSPPTRIVESHYVCNICGAAFMKPSALTDHIQKHELGKTRDCCVCRHVLDLPRRRPGLFKCQYCGQRFARAYCCELHQEACAKRLGKVHDVTSSLMLLR